MHTYILHIYMWTYNKNNKVQQQMLYKETEMLASESLGEQVHPRGGLRIERLDHQKQSKDLLP